MCWRLGNEFSCSISRFQLPERTVDVVGIKQQLLSQYDVLQRRIGDLKEATEKEVFSS